MHTKQERVLGPHISASYRKELTWYLAFQIEPAHIKPTTASSRSKQYNFLHLHLMDCCHRIWGG